MNDALRMQISAFVDGELPENENELLLRRLSQDAALRQQVAQYLEIGRLMRGDHEVPGMNELRDRIAAALGEEPVQHTADAGTPASRFNRPAVGVAIAASVAVMALVGIRQLNLPDEADVIDDNFVGRIVPDSQGESAQSKDELLKQFYLIHEPSLVTWRLEFESEEEPADDDETGEDEDEEVESQD